MWLWLFNVWWVAKKHPQTRFFQFPRLLFKCLLLKKSLDSRNSGNSALFLRASCSPWRLKKNQPLDEGNIWFLSCKIHPLKQHNVPILRHIQFLALLWPSIVHYYFWLSYWSTTGHVLWLQTPAFSRQCCLAEDNVLGFPARATLKVFLSWISPGSIQMMPLQTIPRKKCFPMLLKNGSGLKLYHLPSLAWDNWVILYQHCWHPKGSSWRCYSSERGFSFRIQLKRR